MWNERRAREALLDTFGDVRMDGTIASISGSDSPHILITNSLQQYIELTGDLSVLMEEKPYFDDFSIDGRLQIKGGIVYAGTILEHLLILNLVAFYESPCSEQLIRCLKEISNWIQSLWEKQGIRYFEIAMELDVLLTHREDLLKEENYICQVMKQYKNAVKSELVGVKTYLPAGLIIDSLESKISWMTEQYKEAEE